MRTTTTTILYLCASALSSFTNAAPAAVAIDLGTVTEQIPLKDAPSPAKLHREQRTSKGTTEAVNLWIDDFGNVEAIPTSHLGPPVDVSLLSPSSPATSTEKVANLYNKQALALLFHFFSSPTGQFLWFISGGLVLVALLCTLLRISTRPHRIRVRCRHAQGQGFRQGHKRGLSKYSL